MGATAAAVGAQLFGTAVDAWSQSSANRTNVKLAREQMAFQERMSSTEVQRRVADLKAAGLNPMLAYMGAASSPQGARTEVQPVTRNTGSNLSSAFGNMVQAKQLQNMDVQNRLLEQQVEQLRIDNSLNRERVPYAAGAAQFSFQKLKSDAESAFQAATNLQIDQGIKEEQLRTGRLTNDQLEKMQPLLLQLQKLDVQARQLGMKGLENMSNFEESAGKAAPFVRFLIEMLRGGRAALRE